LGEKPLPFHINIFEIWQLVMQQMHVLRPV